MPENREAKVKISELVFNDESEFKINDNDIIVFVGANNSGKSQTLKDIYQRIADPNIRKSQLLNSIDYRREGNFDDIINKLNKYSTFNIGEVSYYRGLKFAIHKDYLERVWKERKGISHDLAPLFCNFLETKDRLNLVEPPNKVDYSRQKFEHPILLLDEDPDIEKKASILFKEAFNKDLIINHKSGIKANLHVGDDLQLLDGEQKIDKSYTSRLLQLPLLHEQGDGMKAFAGIILNAFITDYDMVLIDEPEAFLHPSQARILGKMLAKNLPKHTQLFLATHSSDIIKGLLDSTSERVRILRINRQENTNLIKELDNEEIKQVWNDPILKYSNVLDGLFHQKVVVCEADTDCTFYQSMLDAICEKSGKSAPDIMFTHGHGKDKIPDILLALNHLDVPLAVIADIDFLANKDKKLKESYEILGGNWDEIQPHWKILDSTINQQKKKLKRHEVKETLLRLLDNKQEQELSAKEIENLNAVLKNESGWSKVKKGGDRMIPVGDATRNYKHLISLFASKKIFIVEVGELEKFVREVGNKAGKWVNVVLTTYDLKSDPALEEARTFIERVFLEELK